MESATKYNTEGGLRLRRAYKAAEWHLYHYQELKARLARTREEMEEDAYSAQYGQYHDGTPVKSSSQTSPTEREGMRLATVSPGAQKETTELWVRAIENVWAMLSHEDRYKAEFMERVFALTGRPHGPKSKGYVRDKIMNIMGIDRVNTFYRWKSEIINEVIYAALELNLLWREMK